MTAPDVERERDDAFWRAYEAATEDFSATDERYEDGYVAGFVDCAVQAAAPQQAPARRRGLRLVRS